MKFCIKFVATLLLLSTISLISPRPLKGADPAPLCDPSSQTCRSPIPPPPVL